VGEWKQTQAPKMDRDVLDLIEKRKIPVYVIAEDLADRGIEQSELVPGVEMLSRTALAGLFANYAVVNHW
jgi:sulfur relay (sulfurtransferase) DsrF/TusC family protein